MRPGDVMIYFDNAATTNKKPPSVIRAVKNCIKEYSANPGRGAHRLSLRASEAVYDARERAACFFSSESPERVVFTYNTTYALNLAIKSIVKPGAHVLISNLEHNSVVRPIQRLKDTANVSYSVFDAMASDLKSEIISHLHPETQVIVSTIASNVTGREIPLDILTEIKQKYKLKLIIDAAQAAGHKKVSLAGREIDAFCFPAHKAMLGIMGTGVCIFGEEYEPQSLIEGGSGILSKSLYMPTDLPEALEAGTLGLPGIVALSEGIKFLEGYGICEVERQIDELTELLGDRISEVKGARVIGAGGGVVSFLLRDLGSEHIASRLDELGICTRAGLHCAPLAHEALGTAESGTVRASLSIFNTKREIDAFYRALSKI